MPKVDDIVRVIERYAPVSLQESWDNTGLQVGHRDMEVEGVLTCVDVTPDRVAEALEVGANMIVSHHPLLFRGLKSITGDTGVQRAVEMALQGKIAIYSSHTATDSTTGGISAIMAEKMGAEILGPLQPTAPGAMTGLGVLAQLPRVMTPDEFIALAKDTFGCSRVRFSNPTAAPQSILRVALCGGAGDDMIALAVQGKTQAYVTGELRYHHFVDYASDILLVDCGHYETEQFAKYKFKELISSAFPDLKTIVSDKENNPVNYI